MRYVSIFSLINLFLLYMFLLPFVVNINDCQNRRFLTTRGLTYLLGLLKLKVQLKMFLDNLHTGWGAQRWNL